MRKTAKLGLTALVAAALFATAISTASARSLSVSEQNIRLTFASLEFASELVTLRCPVTFEGSFHSRTIPKVERTLIGYFNRIPVKEESCTNARMRMKNPPYHITYEGFTGTLPNITGILLLLRLVRFELIVSGLCTADYGLTTDNITGTAAVNASGEITGLTPLEGRNTTGRVSGTGICPPTSTFRGSASVARGGNSTTRITVRLI